MSTRRRYDTTALVGKMRQERRRNLVLGVCAAGTLAGLVIFYMLNMRGMTIPEVPADVTPHAPRGEVAAPAVSAAPGFAGPPPGKQPTIIEERPPAMSIIRSSMPASATLWIDDASVPRGTQLQLTQGRHAVRVKVGKHTIRERIEVTPGEHLEIKLDARKKKLVVERHAIAAKSRKDLVWRWRWRDEPALEDRRDGR